MPQEDKTGPRGEGPLTGRGLGICREEEIEPKETLDLRRGRGFGFRRDFFGRRNNI